MSQKMPSHADAGLLVLALVIGLGLSSPMFHQSTQADESPVAFASGGKHLFFTSAMDMRFFTLVCNWALFLYEYPNFLSRREIAENELEPLLSQKEHHAIQTAWYLGFEQPTQPENHGMVQAHHSRRGDLLARG